jgi:hypothetical protein
VKRRSARHHSKVPTRREVCTGSSAEKSQNLCRPVSFSLHPPDERWIAICACRSL